MTDGPVLFWTAGPDHGGSRPIRSGDLMRVMEAGWGWKEEGKIVMVIDVVDPKYTNFVPQFPDDLFIPDGPEECLVVIDGHRDVMRIEYLEPLVD